MFPGLQVLTGDGLQPPPVELAMRKALYAVACTTKVVQRLELATTIFEYNRLCAITRGATFIGDYRLQSLS